GKKLLIGQQVHETDVTTGLEPTANHQVDRSDTVKNDGRFAVVEQFQPDRAGYGNTGVRESDDLCRAADKRLYPCQSATAQVRRNPAQVTCFETGEEKTRFRPHIMDAHRRVYER